MGQLGVVKWRGVGVHVHGTALLTWPTVLTRREDIRPDVTLSLL